MIQFDSLCARTGAPLVLAALAACTSPAAEPQRPRYEPPRPAPPVTVTADAATPEAEPGAGAPAPAKERPRPAVSGATGGAAGAEGALAQGSEVLADDVVIATVDGRPIRVSDLLQHWMTRESRQVWEYLRTLVDDEIARVEATKMGIALDPVAVDAAVIDVRMQIEASIAENQPGVGFDDYVRGRFGISPETYVEGIRRNTARGMLMERVVRTWLMTQEHAELRVIIVTNEELADRVQEELDSGRDFGEVASELSEDESRDRAGRMPPVIRTEELLFSRLAFSTPVGGVTGPIEDNGRIMWVNVTGFPEPLEGSWAVLSPAIEASLSERPLEEYEFLQWKSFIDLEHSVDVAPFLELIGESPESP